LEGVDGNYIMSFKSWQEECRYRLFFEKKLRIRNYRDSGAIKKNTNPYNLLNILCGDNADILRSFTSNWKEYLIAKMLYVNTGVSVYQLG
jgi:hypothetical protein